MKRQIYLLLFVVLCCFNGFAQKNGKQDLVLSGYKVTPECFGCKGDSATDDTKGLQSAIDFCKANNRMLVSEKGKVYAITAPLDLSVPHEMQIDFGGAVLLATKPMEYMLKYDNGTDYSTSHSNIINNLVLDCQKQSGGIFCENAMKTSFNFIMIRNCSKKAFASKSGYEIFFTNSHIHCTTGEDSYGIYMEHGDCHFDNIVIIDAHTAVFQQTHGVNFYDKIHAWLYNHVEGTIFFDVNGLALLNQCYFDTAEKGYNIHGFAILKLVNCQHYNNPECYDSPNHSTLFFFENEKLAKTSNITCTDCDFNSGSIKESLSNYSSQRIQFENCLIDPSIQGNWGRFAIMPMEGISFNKNYGEIKDNNYSLTPARDFRQYLYADANVEQKNRGKIFIKLGTIPQDYLPSMDTYGLCVFIWDDGTYSQGCFTMDSSGTLELNKGKDHKKKSLKRVILDIQYN